MSEASESRLDPDPQALSEAVGKEFYRLDATAQAMGFSLDAIAPGEAIFSMTVRPDMVNSHGICHGGFIFALADTAFAYACNARNRRSVAQTCSITYLASARSGDRLTVQCREVGRAGQSALYDAVVADESGETIALFRGQSRTIRGTIVESDRNVSDEGKPG